MPIFGGGSDPGAAKGLMNTETGYGSQFSQRGGQAWNALFPTLYSDITNPQGYTAQQKAEMNTAASQGLGGAMGSAVGQGNLVAGRTRNPGSLGVAMDEAARGAGRTLSQRELGVEESSANLAQQKQQAALKELGALYGTNVTGLSDMLRAANESLSTYESAKEHEGSVLGDITQIGKAGASLASAGLPI